MNKVSLPAPTANLAASILGMWRLKSREDVDASGQRRVDPLLGPTPLGILCFAPGYFAMQLMRRDRSAPENAQRQVQTNNNSSAVDGYDAYFGTYTLDETNGALTVHLEASISPSNIGSSFVRDIRMIDDELVIQLSTTTADDGAPITRTLTFSRLG